MSGGKPKYRLVYFDVRGLAEAIRWIFAYSGTPFEDERIPWDYVTWFKSIKAKYVDSVAQVPLLHEEGVGELSQSHVISRYMAQKFNLVGDNEWENAKVDEVISMVYDLFCSWRLVVFQRNPEVRKEGKAMVDAKFKLYYRKFSMILAEREGPYILGKKLTHADFWLANFISMWNEPFAGDGPIMPEGLPEPSEEYIYIGLANQFPHIVQHQQAVEKLPGIKEWIAKRHRTIL